MPKICIYVKHNTVDTKQKFIVSLSLFSYASFIFFWNIEKEGRRGQILADDIPTKKQRAKNQPSM